MLNQKLELLAPAGRWDVLESVVDAGADAVYLGGKKFNMRMLKSDFNFTVTELIRAAEYLHQAGKKIYITLNNLYFDYELEELKHYLLFLQEIKVDALIIQDLAIVGICRDLGISIPLHSSVQMGIGNLEGVRFLESRGLNRVILSKNLSLQEITEIHNNSNMSLEFFVHGDLCVCHTGQCYMSQLLFSHSGNRGRCRKPCRWRYRMETPDNRNDKNSYYYLANKDLCLYPYLDKLVKAGISSFKIEGRMRSAEYLHFLVSKYRKALDRLIKNPDDYQVDQGEMDELIEKRVRDYTRGHLYGRPGIESIGLEGNREPHFYTAPRPMDSILEDAYIQYQHTTNNIAPKPELTVSVGNLDALTRLSNMDVDNIVLDLDLSRQDGAKWGYRQVEAALDLAAKTGVKIFLETPRTVVGHDLDYIKKYGIERMKGLQGIIVNDYGSLRILSNLLPEKELWAGSALNLTNSEAVREIQAVGVKRITASPEIELGNLKPIIASGAEVELMVQGPLCGMVTDVCLTTAVNHGKRGICPGYCTQGQYALIDEYEQKYRLRTDLNCRNYIFAPYDLCLFGHLPVLVQMGITSVKIEGKYYNDLLLSEIVNIYRQALDAISKCSWDQEENYRHLLELFPQGLTTRPYIP